MARRGGRSRSTVLLVEVVVEGIVAGVVFELMAFLDEKDWRHKQLYCKFQGKLFQE